MRKQLKAIAASPGIGAGRLLINREEQASVTWEPNAENRSAERERFAFAVQQFAGSLRQKARQIAPVVGQEQADILLFQAQLAEDPYLQAQVDARIAVFQTAEQALDGVVQQLLRSFRASENSLTSMRAADIQDVRDGLLRRLAGLSDDELTQLPPGTILVAKTLTASTMSVLDRDRVAGLVLCTGGRASHVAILARSMGIPAIVGMSDVMKWAKSGELAVMDGDSGELILSPGEEEWETWKHRQEAARADRDGLRAFSGRKTRTADGKPIVLGVSIGQREAFPWAEDCDGVGLLRTEFLFLQRASLPDEEEQYRCYRDIAAALKGKPLVIRTLDIGGDKQLSGLQTGEEENPALGCRGVRFSVEQPEPFLAQLRAILRCAARAPARILVPMITGVKELRWVRECVARCEEELAHRGLEYGKNVPVGAMIETPAAALTADLMAGEADFFSIGVNDLTQFTMAVDRGSSRVSGLYSYYDPAMLRTVRNVIAAGKAAGLPVTMCGQAGEDPLYIPLLLAFGLERFSVQTPMLLSVRRWLSLWSMEEASRLAEEALALETEGEVLALLQERARV